MSALFRTSKLLIRLSNWNVLVNYKITILISLVHMIIDAL